MISKNFFESQVNFEMNVAFEAVTRGMKVLLRLFGFKVAKRRSSMIIKHGIELMFIDETSKRSSIVTF